MSERRLFHTGRISARNQRNARPRHPRRWTSHGQYHILILEHDQDVSRYLMSHKRLWFYIEIDRQPIVRPIGSHFPFAPTRVEVQLGMPMLQMAITRESARSIWDAYVAKHRAAHDDGLIMIDVERVMRDFIGIDMAHEEDDE